MRSHGSLECPREFADKRERKLELLSVTFNSVIQHFGAIYFKVLLSSPFIYWGVINCDIRLSYSFYCITVSKSH